MNRKNIVFLIAIVLLTAVWLAGCTNDESNVVAPTINETVESDNHQPSSKSGEICYPMLQADQQDDFTLWDRYQIYSTTFQPWQTGTWDLQCWHTDFFYPQQFATVYYYWRDALNPNDPWHYFGSDNVFWETHSHETFYSGSIGITYKIQMVVAAGDWAPFNVKMKAVTQ